MMIILKKCNALTQIPILCNGYCFVCLVTGCSQDMSVVYVVICAALVVRCCFDSSLLLQGRFHSHDVSTTVFCWHIGSSLHIVWWFHKVVASCSPSKPMLCTENCWSLPPFLCVCVCVLDFMYRGAQIHIPFFDIERNISQYQYNTDICFISVLLLYHVTLNTLPDNIHRLILDLLS